MGDISGIIYQVPPDFSSLPPAVVGGAVAERQEDGEGGPEWTHRADGDGDVAQAHREVEDRSGERDLPVPADLMLPEPPPLTGDPRLERMDWKFMAEVEIAPYTELAKTLHAAMEGKPSPSPVPPASFADGVANMEVMDAIRQSHEQGGAMVKVGSS